MSKTAYLLVLIALMILKIIAYYSTLNPFADELKKHEQLLFESNLI